MSIFCWDFDGTLAYCNHLWSGSVFRALNETVASHSVTFQDIRRCNASGFTWHTPEKDFTDLVGEKWWEFMNAHFFRSFVSLGIDEKQAKAASEKVREIIMLPSNYNLFDDTVFVLEKAKEKAKLEAQKQKEKEKLAAQKAKEKEKARLEAEKAKEKALKNMNHTKQKGDWILVYYREDSDYYPDKYIFAYNDKQRKVRYIAEIAFGSRSGYPYYHSLDW